MIGLRQLNRTGFTLGFVFLCALWSAEAQPLIYQATGTREQIQPIIDQFQHDIIFGPGGTEQSAPETFGRFKVATFEDVDISLLGQWQWSIASGGLDVLSSSSSSFYVNSDPLSFSSPNCLQMGTGATSRSDSFYVENLDPNARFKQNAFGAVFSNVSSPTAAALVGWLADGTAFRFDAQVTTDSAPFSFIGLIDTNEFFNTTMVRMDATFSPLRDRLPSGDSVIADDLILGVAPPLPEPSAALLALVGGLLFWTSFRHQNRQR